VILPVWHGVDREYILQFSPTLADAVAVPTSRGLPSVASEVARAIRAERVLASEKSGERIPFLAKTRPWVLLVITWVLSVLSLTLSAKMASIVESKPDSNLGVFVALLQVYAPAVHVSVLLWYAAGILANLMLLLGAVLVTLRWQTGSQIIRIECGSMILLVPALAITAVVSASSAPVLRSPGEYRDLLETAAMLASCGFVKWLTLLIMYRIRQ